MTQPQPEYRFEYVSGAFVPYPGQLWSVVANAGVTSETVQVLGFDGTSQIFDSMINLVSTAFDPVFPYSTDGIVQPGATWGYPVQLTDLGPNPLRVVIRVTGDRLVPSLVFVNQNLSNTAGASNVELTICWPNGFAVFPLLSPPHGPPPPPPPPANP